ncbi:MAG: helix-turn-helix domain-containing protein [Promethearchaeota archaeon]
MLHLLNRLIFCILFSFSCLYYSMKRKTSMNLKEKKKKELYELVREMYYNKGLSIKALAEKTGKSERTIYRWIKRGNQAETGKNQKKRKKYHRSKRYSCKIFERIIALKEEIPRRSAPMIHRILRRNQMTCGKLILQECRPLDI